MALALDVAALVALIMQAVMYGVFLVLFGACLHVLINKKKTAATNWPFLTTACVMFVLITINFAVSWSRIMDAFIVLQDVPGGAVAYLGDLTKWKEVFRTGSYIALSAVADTLFIYRLWIVWSRNNWVVVLPILLLLGSITTGIGIEVEIATLHGSGVFATQIAAFATSFFSISLVQNLLTTSLIVWRIWRVNMGAREMGQRSLWPVMAVILESGAIYSATLGALLFTYAAGSFAQYICLDMVVPIIGCTFTLIIVRVGLGLAKSGSPNGQGATTHAYTTQPRIPMSKININVARTVDVDQEHDLERGGDSDMGDEGFDKVLPAEYSVKNGSTMAF